MLTTEGRGGAPEKMLLELSDGGQWHFRGNGDALLQEQERQKAIGSLNDRQASALEHVEETWESTKVSQGTSADLLASLMKLSGADTCRTARRLLEQLRERGLVRKVLQSEGKDRALVARYIPTSSSIEPQSADYKGLIPLSEDGKGGADSPDYKRQELKIYLDPTLVPAFDVGDSVELKTNQLEMTSGWTVSAIADNKVDIVRSDSGGAMTVCAGDLVYMPF